MKMSTRRLLSSLAFVGVVVLGLVIHTGLGTASSFGWNYLATLCPLGALQVMVAGRGISVGALACLVVTVVLVVIFGRAFCGWLCPVPLARRLVGGKKAERASASRASYIGQEDLAARQTSRAGRRTDGVCPEAPTPLELEARAKAELDKLPTASGHRSRPRIKAGRHDMRLWVLLAALVSTAIFGFPVFCLVCPVGLTAATLVSVWHIVQYGEFTVTVLIFPAIVAVEIIVLRRWCHQICPIGALMGLLSRGNKTLRPQVSHDACLRDKGRACHLCYRACPEGIDLHDPSASVHIAECTKCAECVMVCPTKAVTMTLVRGRDREANPTTPGPSRGSGANTPAR